jgi:hypothetical protein
VKPWKESIAIGIVAPFAIVLICAVALGAITCPFAWLVIFAGNGDTSTWLSAIGGTICWMAIWAKIARETR